MSKHKLTYNDLINFAIALDTHILNTEAFFDDNFLNLLEEHLGYSSSSFVCYESNSIYKTSQGHNLPMGETYEQNFLTEDPLAKYISTNFNEIYSRDINITKSSEVFSDYHSSRYHMFLNKYMDLGYVAVIPFNNLRLSVYKTESEGDFTPDEIRMLHILEKIIISKYILFSKIIQPSYGHTLEELKNKYFDTLSTGVIILNDQYIELNCNSVGRKYMNSLSPALSISSYFSNLIPLLNLSPLNKTPIYTERLVKLDDYIINIRLYPTSEKQDSTSQYVYFITIELNTLTDESEIFTENNRHEPLSPEQLNQEFARKYHLSPRETEVVEALSQGQKYQDIANTLFISINTVRTHVKNIYQKLEIDNQRTLLFIYNQFLQDAK